MDRNLAEVTSSSHLQRHLVDMIGSEVDEDAQRCLHELKAVKLVDSISPDSCVRLEYSQPSHDAIRSTFFYRATHIFYTAGRSGLVVTCLTAV